MSAPAVPECDGPPSSDPDRRMQLAIDWAVTGIAFADLSGALTYVNRAFLRMWSYRRPEDVLGRQATEFWENPNDPEAVIRALQSCSAWEGEMTAVRGDGTRFDAFLFASMIVDERGAPMAMMGSFVDVSARKVAQEKARLAAQVFEQTSEAIVVTDAAANILYVNKAFTTMSGYEPEEVVGRNPRILQSGRHGPEFFAAMWQSLSGTGHWRGEIWDRRKDGAVFPKWMTIGALRDSSGRVSHYVALSTDITNVKAAEARLHHLANYDQLTGEPNRSLLFDRLGQALASAQHAGHRAGVVFVDLDRFKVINDTLGHRSGNRVLVEAARRLRAAVGHRDTVARVGDDEFAVILSDVREPEDATHFAQTILASLAEPVHLDGTEVVVTASVGIALSPEDGAQPDALLRNAEAAMHDAQRHGRSTFRFYTHQLNRRAADRLHLESRLRRSVSRNELELHYQPKVETSSGRITGVEALMRWHDPQLGHTPPSQFIPVAEDTGLIVPLGEWALWEACRQAQRWRQQHHADLRVAVNLSGRQLQRSDLRATVQRVLAETGLDPRMLTLEITESVLIEGEDSPTLLAGLKQLGVDLSIDDFGTGYSSLSYLTRLPVDELKIDRSFVRDILDSRNGMAVVTAIIALAHSLGMTVTAEGVETESQASVLRELGCDLLQGFLVSRALPASQIVGLLAGQRPRGVSAGAELEENDATR